MKAQWLEVFNEAHYVFVFDKVFQHEILAADPLLFGGIKPFDPLRFRPLFDQGKLFIYDLYLDDLAVVRVIEGGLPPDIASCIKLLSPALCGLRIPTGNLCVGTLNSLNPNGRSASGIAKVTPGNYLVALHRIDWGNVGLEKFGELGWFETIVLGKPKNNGVVLPAGRFISRQSPTDDLDEDALAFGG